MSKKRINPQRITKNNPGNKIGQAKGSVPRMKTPPPPPPKPKTNK